MDHSDLPTRDVIEISDNSDKDTCDRPAPFTLIPSSVSTTTKSYTKKEKKITTTSSHVVTTSTSSAPAPAPALTLHSNLGEEYTSQIVIEDKCTILNNGKNNVQTDNAFCYCNLMSFEEFLENRCKYCVIIGDFMSRMKNMLQLDDCSDEISLNFQLGTNKKKRKTPEPKVEISTCSICFEDYGPGEYVQKVDCFCNRGYFHKKCIDKWLKKKQTCPLCRDSVSKNTKKIKI